MVGVVSKYTADVCKRIGSPFLRPSLEEGRVMYRNAPSCAVRVPFATSDVGRGFLCVLAGDLLK